MLRLFQIYQTQGFDIRSGINLAHVEGRSNTMAAADAAATYLYRNHDEMVETGGGGVSMHEIPLFEQLSLVADFKSIFIVGNSFGWSTLLVSILWPEAEVVALDCGFAPSPTGLHRRFKSFLHWLRGEKVWNVDNADFGIKFTNETAQTNNLKAKVVKGFSPGDVKPTAAKLLSQPPDFAFIDGRHTLPQVLLDYRAIREIASKDCVYLFHDIVNFRLEKSFNQILAESQMEGRILWQTPSGMGILYPKSRSVELAPVLEVFGQRERFIQNMRRNHFRKKIAYAMEVVLLDSGIDRMVRGILGSGHRN